ncbi:hypothetical protein CR513_28154, partial [Mucuna pruriens]
MTCHLFVGINKGSLLRLLFSHTATLFTLLCTRIFSLSRFVFSHTTTFFTLLRTRISSLSLFVFSHTATLFTLLHTKIFSLSLFVFSHCSWQVDPSPILLAVVSASMVPTGVPSRSIEHYEEWVSSDVLKQITQGATWVSLMTMHRMNLFCPYLESYKGFKTRYVKVLPMKDAPLIMNGEPIPW